MAEPTTVRTFGNELLILMDDDTSRRALKLPGDMWIVKGAETEEPPAPASGFIWPFSLGSTTDEYGPRAGGFHRGLDFSQPGGTNIPASGAGTILIAGDQGQLGNTVVIDHGRGLATLYAHMQDGTIVVTEGQTVVQGQTLGKVGDTGLSRGNHLHWETYENGYLRPDHVINPRTWMEKWAA